MRSISRRTNDAEATRHLILESAMRLFAERGPDATSLADIAEAAGVGKGLVAYHFGTKEELYSVAIRDGIRPFLETIDALIGTAKIPEFVEARFAFMAANPRLRRCLAWSSLEENFPLNPDDRQVRFRDYVMGAHETGDLRSDIDPMMLVLIASMAMDGYFRFRQIAMSLFPEDLNRPDFEERFLASILAMIRPCPGSEPSL